MNNIHNWSILYSYRQTGFYNQKGSYIYLVNFIFPQRDSHLQLKRLLSITGQLHIPTKRLISLLSITGQFYIPTERLVFSQKGSYSQLVNFIYLFLQRLHAVIDETERKNLEIKTDLKKLEATKKEKDAKVLMDTIYNQLDDHMKMHQQVSSYLPFHQTPNITPTGDQLSPLPFDAQYHTNR